MAHLGVVIRILRPDEHRKILTRYAAGAARKANSWILSQRRPPSDMAGTDDDIDEPKLLRLKAGASAALDFGQNLLL